MKKHLILFYLMLLFNPFSILLQAQNQEKASRWIFRAEGSGYLFFSGSDRSAYGTTMRGFGSGLLDVWNSRGSIEYQLLKAGKISVSAGLGNSVNKYRFSENLVPRMNDEGIASFIPDPDPTHEYGDGFFGYGKTKLVTSSLYIPLNLNIQLGEKIDFSAGVFADWMFFAKYKMKYLDATNKEKIKIPSKEMMQYPWNRFKAGLHAGIYHREWEQGLSVSYYVTPLFQKDMGPELNEFRIGIVYQLKPLTDALKNK